MSTEIIVALIALGGSLASLAWNYVLQRRAADFARRAAEENAARDYQYEARKRLYAQLQPLLFQLAEASESAFGRITNLALASKKHGLDLNATNWVANDEYYRVSTIYRLIAPAVLVRLCQRRMTFVDLTVDERLSEQYALAKLIYSTWNDGYDVAEADPSIPYRPRVARLQTADDPTGPRSVYQHVVIGELDLLVEALTAPEGTDALRCLDLGEFWDAYRDEESPLRRRASVVENLFDGFRPDRRPVLWRLLLCQACLHRALVRSFGTSGVVSPADVLTPDDRARLDWRTEDETDVTFEDAVEASLTAVRTHLDRELARSRLSSEAHLGRRSEDTGRRWPRRRPERAIMHPNRDRP